MPRWGRVVLWMLGLGYVALAIYMDLRGGMSPLVIAGALMGFLWLVLR